MKKTILIIFSCLLLCLRSSAQEDLNTSKFESGIELGSNFCYTGLNVNLAYALAWKENVIFAGPKITLSDSYVPTQGPWGIYAGYRRFLPGESKLRSFATMEYQVVFLEPANPNSLDIKGKNEIHELHFSYGIQYTIWNNLTIGNSMGAGIYFERFFDSLTGNKNTYEGFDGQIRLFVQYSF